MPACATSPRRRWRALDPRRGGYAAAMRRLAMLALVCAAATAAAQSPQFAPPVRLKAGDKFLGEQRLYPSPVFHDLDGDGAQDVVVGDLIGVLTLAPRAKGAGALAYGAETEVLAADGKPLDFNTW